MESVWYSWGEKVLVVYIVRRKMYINLHVCFYFVDLSMFHDNEGTCTQSGLYESFCDEILKHLDLESFVYIHYSYTGSCTLKKIAPTCCSDNLSPGLVE